MASLAVVQAVRARLDASPVPGWPVVLPNPLKAGAPADASVFMAVEFPTCSSEQLTIGAPGTNVFRETGTILFTLAAPIGTELDIDTPAGPSPLAVVDLVRALFRNAFFGGVQVWEPSPARADDANADGLYFRLRVSAPYRFDFTA